MSLARLQKFSYAFAFATNVKSKQAFLKLGYEQILRGDAWEYEVEGIRPFRLVREGDRYPTVLMKEIV